MCYPRRKMPTNQTGQATRLWLLHCQSIQIRVFHITWFTFWLCFFGWFATANLGKQITPDLGLTDVHKAIAGGCSVASTVIFRVIVGYFCDKVGAKKSYAVLLVVSAFPICAMALVTTPAGFIVTSLFIGIAGAAFVITQYHTTMMFAGKTVGTANATSAGWGNFGGGCANFFMPLLLNHFMTAYDLPSNKAWRYCMIVPGLLFIVMAIVYWFFTVDMPPLPESERQRQEKEKAKPNAMASNTLDDKKADKSKGGFMLAVRDYRTWILFCVYAACFGIELTVLRFAAAYFVFEFGLSQTTAGLIILCFSFCNLFARSIGGIVADVVSRFAKKSLNGRVYSLFVVLMFEAIFLLAFAFGKFTNSLGYTIFMLIMFSLGVQAAEGVTFAIVPFVQPKAIGPVSGIVGAGGNMGAMLFAFCIFTQVPASVNYWVAWLILGIFVFIVSFMVMGISFTDDEIRAADEKMNTWQEMEPEKDANQRVKSIDETVDGNDKNDNNNKTHPTGDSGDSQKELIEIGKTDQIPTHPTGDSGDSQKELVEKV